MRDIRLIGNSIVLLLISLVLISCGNVPVTLDQAKEISSKGHYPNTGDQPVEIKSESPYPIIEIWQELDGSVPIRGKSLHFRMYDDGAVEFDYERKEKELAKPRYTYSIQRMPPTKISEEEFRIFKSLIEDLTKSKDIKQEYPPVGLTLDVITKLTILLKENETTEKKIIINDSDRDVANSRFEKKFPNSLINLIKEVYLMRQTHGI